MKDKLQAMEQRNQISVLNRVSVSREIYEDDFLVGKTPMYLEDTWEEEE